MRALVLCLGLLICPALALADAAQDAFVQRIEAALAQPEGAARERAVAALFHHAPDDDAWTAEFAPRVIRHIVKLHGRRISFEALSAETETVHLVDGWEYRPNLEVLGQVVFTNLEKPGNDTRALYGRDPASGQLRFPLTTRRLVAPDAPPDKQLQILTIGMHHPPLTFTGWCDIRLSDNSIKRLVLHDQGVGNQTLIRRGQEIRGCEVRNTMGTGALSLRLYVDTEEIFMERAEAPALVIRYPAR